MHLCIYAASRLREANEFRVTRNCWKSRVFRSHEQGKQAQIDGTQQTVSQPIWILLDPREQKSVYKEVAPGNATNLPGRRRSSMNVSLFCAQS